MRVVVLCNNNSSKEELTAQDHPGQDLVWVQDRKDFLTCKQADAFIDLDFENKEEVIKQLVPLLPAPVIINSIIDTLEDVHPSFIRINGWPMMLQGQVVEGACRNEERKAAATAVFSMFGKEIAWLPDETGFITPRVISMIVNEAYHALADGVSTKEEIDVAMKLGTNYPYGPFEWAGLIGHGKIAELLKTLSVQQPRYTPAPLLLNEAAIPPASVPPSG